MLYTTSQFGLSRCIDLTKFNLSSMLSGKLTKSLPIQRLSISPLIARLFTSLLRALNVFDELKQTSGKLDSATKKNASTVFDIDDLIANSPDLQKSEQSFGNYDSYAFGNTAKHPRNVAKELNITGTQAGRTAEVRFGNVTQALRQLSRNLRQEELISRKNQQKRHLRPALLHAEKHRKWWRKNFGARFTHLLQEVLEAKRRGY